MVQDNFDKFCTAVSITMTDIQESVIYHSWKKLTLQQSKVERSVINAHKKIGCYSNGGLGGTKIETNLSGIKQN